MSKKIRIAVIGGGAAGFFSAIYASSQNTEVHLFEKSSKLLSKVRISGGGRCNVTHQPLPVSALVKNYPRGEKFLKKVFPKFSSRDTMDWFENRGVQLKIESDGRVFPVSDDSQSIIDALLEESKKKGIRIHLTSGVGEIIPEDNCFRLRINEKEFNFDRVIVAAGGHPKLNGFSFLSHLKHQLVEPIPSLFTFNTPQEPIKSLPGISFADSKVKLAGTKLEYRGPMIITHWGVSGPAVLKLSAFGAKWLYDQSYEAMAVINWNSEFGENDYLNQIQNFKLKHPKRLVIKHPLFGLPARFWEHLVDRSGIEPNEILGDLSKKQINKLVQNLFCYNLHVKGKTTFKEEFVTAGGVALEGVSSQSMESKYHPYLFFAGEVLDIDGLTGGFNFQSAWSTAYLAGTSAKATHKNE
ncbi:NAD(P)/FAD-dependent oxidoreductase [Algoriphagus sediminis]|uniref:NAD(P)/FAD-dependent oxidoreductase n=1 Tax=Algoriphagus sediminis TaxID=3057113 RepID=A0ABT7YCX3_9BACT|nr:NAD(P)/FAD-dependent oxidoreductase [Algoriphagus sediminis]MDN3204362.1 NAD(P)/FAD-dependent oxidoreductase [Algoriphagus sediminis]